MFTKVNTERVVDSRKRKQWKQL